MGLCGNPAEAGGRNRRVRRKKMPDVFVFSLLVKLSTLSKYHRTSSQEALRVGCSSGMFNRQPFYQEEQAFGAHFL